ncbi:MAG: hypothetical protein VYB65_13355 [Myxococcota bacterium]|nr:hypothetical protein [Myxococcota bacterium]
MNERSIKNALGALVPLSLFILAYVLLSPASWSDALRTTLENEPGLVVVDDELAYDPSDLRGIIFLSESAFEAPMLEQLSRVWWVRPAGAAEADLAGQSARDCREAHGVMLCLVSATQTQTWRLSDHLKGVKASTSKASCVSASSQRKCSYGPNDWEYMRREEHTFAGRTRNCIWTHPVAGEPVTISIPPLPKGAYRFGAGIDDSGMRGELPPVTVDFTINGQAQTLKVVSGARRGFETHPLPALQPSDQLGLLIRAEKTGARFFCWDLIKK